ncbi:hypothetical protein DFH09DRAFT_1072436 [Mycena vulgaris]|nr:hypothetical protein DFH09DRAFT_1072436 [Mycena vulgaris]
MPPACHVSSLHPTENPFSTSAYPMTSRQNMGYTPPRPDPQRVTLNVRKHGLQSGLHSRWKEGGRIPFGMDDAPAADSERELDLLRVVCHLIRTFKPWACSGLAGIILLGLALFWHHRRSMLRLAYLHPERENPASGEAAPERNGAVIPYQQDVQMRDPQKAQTRRYALNPPPTQADSGDTDSGKSIVRSEEGLPAYHTYQIISGLPHSFLCQLFYPRTRELFDGGGTAKTCRVDAKQDRNANPCQACMGRAAGQQYWCSKALLSIWFKYGYPQAL